MDKLIEYSNLPADVARETGPLEQRAVEHLGPLAAYIPHAAALISDFIATPATDGTRFNKFTLTCDTWLKESLGQLSNKALAAAWFLCDYLMLQPGDGMAAQWVDDAELWSLGDTAYEPNGNELRMLSVPVSAAPFAFPLAAVAAQRHVLFDRKNRHLSNQQRDIVAAFVGKLQIMVNAHYRSRSKIVGFAVDCVSTLQVAMGSESEATGGSERPRINPSLHFETRAEATHEVWALFGRSMELLRAEQPFSEYVGELAARGGHCAQLLHWMARMRARDEWDLGDAPLLRTATVCFAAASCGQRSALLALRSLGHDDATAIARGAASGGQNSLLKWAERHGWQVGPDHVQGLLEAAIGSGRWDIVRWCRANGYSWLQEVNLTEYWWLYPTMGATASRNEIEWAVNDGMPLREPITMAEAAIHTNRVDFLEWLFTYNVSRPTLLAAVADGRRRLNHLVSAALQYGNLKTVQTLTSFDARFSNANYLLECLREALSYKRMEVVQWIVSLPQCPRSVALLETAAKAGSMTALEYLLEALKIPWDPCVFIAAALGGQLEVLQWAQQRGLECSLQEALDKLDTRMAKTESPDPMTSLAARYSLPDMVDAEKIKVWLRSQIYLHKRSVSAPNSVEN